MDQQIGIGDWIDISTYTQGVCIGFDGAWVRYRYEAIRESDGSTIWVENCEHEALVSRVRAPDETSLYVLTLKGPYGED